MLFVSSLESKRGKKKKRMTKKKKKNLHEDGTPARALVEIVALRIYTQGITWSQTKEKAPRDVFLPAWDFDTCLDAANWNGLLLNEISAHCMGRGRKVTHYNYSTWFTELSHLHSPTFPLISFGDLCMWSVNVCAFDIYRGLISFSLHRCVPQIYYPVLLF